MKCKNCQTDLSDNSKFCLECGAKVVRDRITFSHLWSDLMHGIFGWDNKYFFTIKMLVIKPGVIFDEYISGTRKKYVNPFTFFAIGIALTLLVLNVFSEEYLDMSSQLSDSQSMIIDQAIDNDSANPDYTIQKQAKLNTILQEGMLKYYNIISFVFLPLYALIAFLVFWKPYNYGEHLVINAYLQGLTSLVFLLSFIISLVSIPSIYQYGIFFSAGVYPYAYAKFYHLSFGKTIIKTLKFIGISSILFLILVALGYSLGHFIDL